ncbi:MAG: TolC family protein, partial [Acidobacteria bacterium]|nr:TolC family protein [Acidobacteriota bacterium]
LTGQAAYHSNVPSLPAGLGASPPQDQYVVALDADQRIWDGGRTAGEKAVEEASRDLDVAAVDVDAYDWRQQVEAVYFGVLAKNAEIDLLKTLVEDLEAQLSVLDARVDAGVALAGDQASLAAEAEGQRQRIVEAEGERRAALAQLSTLSGQVIPDDAVLATPDPQPPADLVAAATAAATGEGVDRPEIEQAKATRQLLQEQMHLVGLATKPTVSAFAQGGIGRPADQDFFETDPTPYVVLGLRVRWKPLDWGVSEREQEIRDLQLGINGSRLDTFFTSLSASLRRLAERIESSRAVLASDDRIVELRRQSSEQAAAQLRAGVITPSAYLLERNAEHRARLTREQHHLSLIRDSVDFVTTLGASS